MSKENKHSVSDKDLAKMWPSSHEKREDFGSFTPDDGKHTVKVTEASYGRAKSGRAQVKWVYTFLTGDYKGKQLTSFDGIETEQGQGFVMRRIEALGLDAPEEFDELEGTLKKITKTKPAAVIRTKINGDFTNVYIEKLLTEEEAEELEDASDDKKDDDDDDKDDKKSSSKVSKDNDDDDDKDDKKDEPDFEVGQMVSCVDSKGKKLGTGKIKSVDEDDEELVVKIDGEKHTVDFDDATPVKDDDDDDDDKDDKKDDKEEPEVTINVGDKMMALDEDDDEIGVGKIKSIDAKAEEVVIKIDGKKHTIAFAKLRLPK